MRKIDYDNFSRNITFNYLTYNSNSLSVSRTIASSDLSTDIVVVVINLSNTMMNSVTFTFKSLYIQSPTNLAAMMILQTFGIIAASFCGVFCIICMTFSIIIFIFCIVFNRHNKCKVKFN